MGSEIGLKDSVEYSASFVTKVGVQDYDLQKIINLDELAFFHFLLVFGNNANIGILFLIARSIIPDKLSTLYL